MERSTRRKKTTRREREATGEGVRVERAVDGRGRLTGEGD